MAYSVFRTNLSGEGGSTSGVYGIAKMKGSTDFNETRVRCLERF
jgi:hypothetical protein